MTALGSIDGLLRALERALSVRLSAYVLPRGRVLDGLEAAADRGARVAVTLEGAPFADGDDRQAKLAEHNAKLVDELRRHGVDARLTKPDEPPQHLKAAVVDGTAYLNDRNWPDSGRATIVVTDAPDDVAIVSSALDGRPLSDGHLATRKDRALQLEADTVGRAATGETVELETESFSGSTVYAALKDRADKHVEVRLLVDSRDLRANARERTSLERLQAAGVEVRTCDTAEKLCVVGESAWVGSANASGGAPATLDWGMRTGARTVVDALRSRFEERWAHARPLDVPPAWAA